MKIERRNILKQILIAISVLFTLGIIFTVYANTAVEKAVKDRVYTMVDSIPHNKVALLLGTNPLNRRGRPNTYFTNRIKTAAELYHAGKVDFILASGDNHTSRYDEPTAMRDSLIAYGIPAARIVLDFAGFRTLDSVVRAKEVFGCDSLTIISQADHNTRALYLAEANGIEAVAISAPLQAGTWVRTRLALREWLARDKMMLDIWFGKQPHFLGEKISIPEITPQKCYATAEGMTMKIVSPDLFVAPVDSFVVEFTNTRDVEGMTGEWFMIERLSDVGLWEEIPWDKINESSDGTVSVVFNSVGWIVFPDKPFRMTINPWFYDRDWNAGTYRLAKSFSYPPYPKATPGDTVYVEFQIGTASSK